MNKRSSRCRQHRRIERLEPRQLLANVVISEIMFHPASGDAGQEYIELYNHDTQPVNLAGWKFSSGIDYTFSGGTIAAGQYLVVAANLADFQAKYPSVTNVVGSWTGHLSNSSETLTLEDSTNAVIDTVTYADSGDWAIREAGVGRDLVQSITRSGSTATVTILDHGYSNGDTVVLSGADQPQYNGTFTVSGITASTPNTFNITVSGSPATPATGHIIAQHLVELNHSGWHWTSFADGLGSSLELINPNLSNDNGQNWGSSTTWDGTPGGPNSIAAADIAPMILNVASTPAIPKSNQAVTISANLVDELGTATSATLFYRIDAASPPPFTSVPMTNNGQGNWSAVIPAQPNNTIVEFYVSATDGTLTRTWPVPTDPQGTEGANALYQVDDTVYSGTQPLLKLIMTANQAAELAAIGTPNSPDQNTDASMNGTLISVDSADTEERFAIGIRNRGGGSRDTQPNNYRVDINSDNPWHGSTAINLNGRFSMEEVVGSAIYQFAGLPAQNVVPVNVRVNNSNLAVTTFDMFGSYSDVESEDSQFVDNHFSTDSDGNYYSGVNSSHLANLGYLGTNPDSYRPLYTKENNKDADDWTDLINLTKVLDSTQTPDAQFMSSLSQTINIDEWMKYFAVSTLIGDQETTLSTGFGDDYSLYRGTTDTRFQLVIHDLDTILGRGDTSPNVSESIFRATSLPAISRLLKFPDIAPLYYAAILNQINTTFAPANINALIDNSVSSYVDAATRQTMKTFVVNRIANVLTQIPQHVTAASTLTVQSGYPHTTGTTANLTGLSNAVNTRSVLVNGVAATWTAWSASWSASNIALRPGINRVLVQSLDANGKEFERTYIDIWRDTGTTTNVSGTLPAGTTHWTVAGGPYRVTANLTVPSTATLLIDPGTTVYFSAGVGMTVNGTLQAKGTDLQRIRFTKFPGSTAWSQITFTNTNTDNELTYLDQDSAGSAAQNIVLSSSTLNIDHVVWLNTTTHIMTITNSSFNLTNSTIPPTTNVQPIDYSTPFPANGYALFQGNTFGAATGSNDVIDFTGSNRPGPIVQFLDNTFLGSQDDILDLDGTDAHIEGNVFMGDHLANPSNPDTASAISGGADSGQTSEWTIVRNYFYNDDHAVLAKEGAFATLINNTIVHMTVSAINFDEPLRSGIVPGKGAYLDGNIIWDTPLIFENVNSDGTTTDITVRHSDLQTVTVYPGVGNTNLDPQLQTITGITDPKSQLILRPGPGPAVGTGPNGVDMGANVPAGASISGEPSSTTTSTTATLNIGGPEIYAYKYRLNNGAFSNEIDVTNPDLSTAVVPPIQLSGLTNGTYTVYVVIKNSAGIWQPDASAVASKSWTVDTALAPHVRINEVLADNLTTLNVNGSHPDLIELFNDGQSTADLSGVAISDAAGDHKFTFDAGTTLAAGQYLILYGSDAINAPGITLNFSLSTSGEGVYLYDTLANGGGLLDSVVFGNQLADKSIARKDDGSWQLAVPTFGAANVFAPLGDPHQMKINEWFTQGSGSDFIELYNPNTLPVDIGNFYLSDDPIDRPTRQQITPLYFVPAGGLTVFIADGAPASGPDHVDFKLAFEQGQIGLFDASLNRIDWVIYGTQQANQSEGRNPNGGPNFTFFAVPNPGLSNPTSTSPSPSPLRITELYYNPAAHTGVSDKEDQEFIEILNTGNAPESLDNYAITQFTSTPYIFPSGLTLPAGQRIIVARNPDVFQEVYGDGINLSPLGYSPANLSNSGERVALISPTGQTVEDFTYSDSAPWPTLPDGHGPSLEIVDPLGNPGDPTNWRASALAGGSPGSDGVIPDTTPPTVASTSYDYIHQTLLVHFSEDVQPSLQTAFNNGDFEVEPVAGGNNRALANFTYDSSTNTATFSFITQLPNGNYRLHILPGNVKDDAGNPLAEYVGNDPNFFALGGDANHDGTVNVTDLGILASNWQSSGKTYTQGDFDYDGTVNVSDLGILASNWQKNNVTFSAPANAAPMPSINTFLPPVKPPTRTPTRVVNLIGLA